MVSPAQVARMRAQAESRLHDSGRVVANEDETVFDPDTLTDVAATPLLSYIGRLLIKGTSNQPRNIDLAGQSLATSSLQAHFPVEGSETIATGQVVVVTASLYDPGLVGRRFRIVGPQAASVATTRRFPVEELVNA